MREVNNEEQDQIIEPKIRTNKIDTTMMVLMFWKEPITSFSYRYQCSKGCSNHEKTGAPPIFENFVFLVDI